MRGAQMILVGAIGALALAKGEASLFLASAAGIGFCYGSNFAIYPGTVAKVYGSHLLGSVYPMIMAAQGISALGPVVGGCLSDLTHSYMPGVLLSAGVAVAGLVSSLALGARSGISATR
jgi:OFA family oxalate/formate antiporter-like MFS transporter